MNTPENVYEIEIATTPERLWQAITDPEQTRQYFYGALSKSDWKVGSRWTSESPDGEVYLDGEILEIDPPRRLVHTFHVLHKPTAAAEAPSTVVWQITPIGSPSCACTSATDVAAPAGATSTHRPSPNGTSSPFSRPSVPV